MSTLLLVLAWLSAALGAQLTLEVDSPVLTVGETVALQVSLVDGSSRGLPEISTPPGVHLQFQGQGTSRVIHNFDSVRIVRYTYALTVQEPGEHTIGPASLEVGGTRMQSAPLKIRANPAGAAQQAVVDLHASVSEPAPYLGQTVVYSFVYRYQDKVIDAAWTPPDFDGFLEDPTAEASQSKGTVDQDGIAVPQIRIDVPLVTVGAGERTIGPASLTVQVPDRQRSRRRRGFDPFGMSDVKTIRAATQAIPVTVRPLPAGQPKDFSGLIGQFSLEATPSSTIVALGDSVTVDVVISGNGGLSGFKLPPATADAGYRVYDDEPELQAAVRDGRYVSRLRVRRAVVPEAEGPLTVPPIAVTVFDPKAGAFVQLSTEPITLSVQSGDAGAGELTSFAEPGSRAGGNVAALGDDILPVPGDVSVGNRTLAAAAPLVLGLPLLALFGLVGVELRGRSKARPVDPRTLLRAGLQQLPDDRAQRLAALEAVFRDAAALSLGEPAPGLDRARVATLGVHVDRLYGDIEAARYGGGDMADIEARVRDVVDEVCR